MITLFHQTYINNSHFEIGKSWIKKNVRYLYKLQMPKLNLDKAINCVEPKQIFLFE